MKQFTKVSRLFGSKKTDLSENDTNFTVNIYAFGYKYGVPQESDFVFDVRCFPNPFYIDELKEKTGLDKCVRDYVLKFNETKKFVKKLEKLVLYILPLYINKGKMGLTISVGCTGGKHRSVTIAMKLGDTLKKNGYNVNFIYRDLKKLDKVK